MARTSSLPTPKVGVSCVQRRVRHPGDTQAFILPPPPLVAVLLVAGVRMATPLMVVMFTTELSDVAFAVDSVPAVFGVTENMLVAYSSNMFALLSLRSMYVVLAQVRPGRADVRCEGP